MNNTTTINPNDLASTPRLIEVARLLAKAGLLGRDIPQNDEIDIDSPDFMGCLISAPRQCGQSSLYVR